MIFTLKKNLSLIRIIFVNITILSSFRQRKAKSFGKNDVWSCSRIGWPVFFIPTRHRSKKDADSKGHWEWEFL